MVHNMIETIFPPVMPRYEVQNLPSRRIKICDLPASILSNGRKVVGQVTINMTLTPLTLESVFRVESSIGEGELFDVTIDECNGRYSFFSESTSKEVCDGRILGPLEIGDGSSFESLIFHFAKFPSIGKRANYGKESYYPRLTLGSKTWQITIDVHGKCGFDAVGIATKKDGSKINSDEALDLISSLRCYLSFAFGEWCPPLLLVGITDEAIKWRRIERFVVGEGLFDKGWVDLQHPHTNHDRSTTALECGYEGFEALYLDAKWKSSLPVALSLMIQASDPQTDREVSTVISQIPLEMMCDIMGKSCNAACKLTQLLNSIKLPLNVPTSLKSLWEVSKTLPDEDACQGKGDKTPCETTPSTKRGIGPRTAVAVRNCIVHPTVENQQKLSRYVVSSGNPIGLLFDDSTRLFGKYAVLTILKQMEFNHLYFDRIENRYVSVPWTNSASE